MIRIACMTATFYFGGQWQLADSLNGPIARKHDKSLTKKKGQVHIRVKVTE